MRRPLLIMALALVASGCTLRSIEPLYSEDTLVFDRRLLGSWQSDSGEESLLFVRGDDGVYELIHAGDDGATSRYVVHMARIGDELYLDIYPRRERQRIALLHPAHRTDAHFLESQARLGRLAHDGHARR